MYASLKYRWIVSSVFQLNIRRCCQVFNWNEGSCPWWSWLRL